MKKLLIVILCLFSLVDGAAAVKKSTQAAALDGFQKQFLKTLESDDFKNLVEAIVPVMNSQGVPMKSMLDLYTFCEGCNHKDKECLKAISKWIDGLNEDDLGQHTGINLNYMKNGLCLCNIFLNNHVEADEIDWAQFIPKGEQQKDLRQRAFSLILGDIKVAHENGRTAKSEVKKQTHAILQACVQSDHKIFKKIITDWITAHKVSNFDYNWCMCHILISNRKSVMDFAEVAKKTVQSTPTTTPTSPNSSMITFVGVPVATDVGCC